MSKTLLVADDDKTFRRVIIRVFEGTDWKVETAEDGVKALESISNRLPDVLLLDLNMPRLGGREVLARIRGNPRLAMLPVVIISGDSVAREGAIKSGLMAEDIISKPFNNADLVSKIDGAARRARRLPGASPLTFLPGGAAIEEEAARRIKAALPLAFFHVDIDNFKAYNHTYSYLNGDNAIKCVAGLLSDVRSDFSAEEMFVGHIGGDDFAVMSNPRRAEEIAQAIVVGFDTMAPGFYSEADRACGFIVWLDRFGVAWEFPLMTLTVTIATNEKRALDHYARIVDISGELKRELRGLKNRTGSIYLKDKRGN